MLSKTTPLHTGANPLTIIVVGALVITAGGCSCRAKAHSNIDDDQYDDDHDENHILDNGEDVTGKCHLATSPGFFVLTSIVVIRGLCE